MIEELTPIRKHSISLEASLAEYPERSEDSISTEDEPFSIHTRNMSESDIDMEIDEDHDKKIKEESSYKSFSILVTEPESLLMLIKIEEKFPVVVGFIKSTASPSCPSKKGFVEQTGLVEIGDIIISCNDISLENLTLQEIGEAVKVPTDASSTRLLKFLRIPPKSSITISPSERINRSFNKEFEDLLRYKSIDDFELRNLCMRGIPDEQRPVFWRILLGHLPKETKTWKGTLKSQREVYKEISVALNMEELLSKHRSNDAPNDDVSVLYSIQLDVMRTHPSLQFFIREHVSQHCLALTRILFAYAKYNFGITYTQGMNEICAVLYYVFASDKNEEWNKHAEADTYFCFVALMSELSDLFLENMDDTTYGIQGRINMLDSIVNRLDVRVYGHLRREGVETSFYGLRWITTLLSREFDLPDTMRLWDSLFSDSDMLEFTTYICAAMILEQREYILHNDFAGNLQMLQHYPPIDVIRLLERASQIQEKDSKKSRSEQIGEFIGSATADSIKVLASSAVQFKNIFMTTLAKANETIQKEF